MLYYCYIQFSLFLTSDGSSSSTGKQLNARKMLTPIWKASDWNFFSLIWGTVENYCHRKFNYEAYKADELRKLSIYKWGSDIYHKVPVNNFCCKFVKRTLIFLSFWGSCGRFFFNRMEASDIMLCCYFPLCFRILHAKFCTCMTMYATVVFKFVFTSLPLKHVPKKGFGPAEKGVLVTSLSWLKVQANRK